MINEYFKTAADILIEPLYTLFNKISNSRSFPKHWAISLIVPVQKRGLLMTPIITGELP